MYINNNNTTSNSNTFMIQQNHQNHDQNKQNNQIHPLQNQQHHQLQPIIKQNKKQQQHENFIKLICLFKPSLKQQQSLQNMKINTQIQINQRYNKSYMNRIYQFPRIINNKKQQNYKNSKIKIIKQYKKQEKLYKMLNDYYEDNEQQQEQKDNHVRGNLQLQSQPYNNNNKGIQQTQSSDQQIQQQNQLYSSLLGIQHYDLRSQNIHSNNKNNQITLKKFTLSDILKQYTSTTKQQNELSQHHKLTKNIINNNSKNKFIKLEYPFYQYQQYLKPIPIVQITPKILSLSYNHYHNNNNNKFQIIQQTQPTSQSLHKNQCTITLLNTQKQDNCHNNNIYNIINYNNTNNISQQKLHLLRLLKKQKQHNAIKKSHKIVKINNKQSQFIKQLSNVKENYQNKFKTLQVQSTVIRQKVMYLNQKEDINNNNQNHIKVTKINQINPQSLYTTSKNQKYNQFFIKPAKSYSQKKLVKLNNKQSHKHLNSNKNLHKNILNLPLIHTKSQSKSSKKLKTLQNSFQLSQNKNIKEILIKKLKTQSNTPRNHNNHNKFKKSPQSTQNQQKLTKLFLNQKFKNIQKYVEQNSFQNLKTNKMNKKLRPSNKNIKISTQIHEQPNNLHLNSNLKNSQVSRLQIYSNFINISKKINKTIQIDTKNTSNLNNTNIFDKIPQKVTKQSKMIQFFHNYFHISYLYQQCIQNININIIQMHQYKYQ